MFLFQALPAIPPNWKRHVLGHTFQRWALNSGELIPKPKGLINSSKGKGSMGEKVLTGKIQEPDTNTAWSSYSNSSKHCDYKMIFILWVYLLSNLESCWELSIFSLLIFILKATILSVWGGLETNTSKSWTSDLLMVVCQSVFSASTFSLGLVGNLSLSLNLTSFSTDELAEKNCYHNGILKIPLQLLIWQYFFSFSFPDGQSLATSFHLKVSYHMMLTHFFFFFFKLGTCWISYF